MTIPITQALGCVAEAAAVVEALAIVVGVWVAYQGLTAWRPQIRGQAEYDVARKIMLSAYRLRSALLGMRGPWMTSGEMLAALVAEGHARTEATAMMKEDHDAGFAAAYQQRWKRVEEIRAEFDTAVLEGEVHWGGDVRSAAMQLRKLESELYVAVSAVLRDKGRVRRFSEPSEKEIEHLQAQEAVMYGGDGWPNDDFAERVEAAAASLDKIARPHLKG